MITEDYVSFEVAKLLKDKGFNEATNRYYNAQYDGIRTVSDTFMTYWNNEDHMKVLMMEGAIAIPTLQMVCKWLREKYIYICPVPAYFHGDGTCSWQCDIWAGDNYEKQIIEKESYEEAIEAALKYVLENLI